MGIFYKPNNSWAGDFIPFYWDGEYHLFYLRDHREHGSLGGTPHLTPWHHVGTKDAIHFSDYGDAISRGTRQDQDMCAYTGCVIEADGIFHIFYMGNNPLVEETGLPKEAIMHATSRDLINWDKDPTMCLYADTDIYERDDWRDPFVFWNEEEHEYWMLLAARLKNGSDFSSGRSNRGGCIALCTSDDLVEWKIRPPLWSPSLYYTHECPDLFKIGDWWYLIFSEFSETHVTRYRMSKSITGPWIAPKDDTFDARAWYAAKTASNGTRRFGFGWNPTRVGENDEGLWEWGGSLIVHEINQQPDGSLTVKLPQEVESQFHQKVYLPLEAGKYDWQIDSTTASAQAIDGFGWCATTEPLNGSYLISTDAAWESTTQSLGILTKIDNTLDNGYQIKLEPHRNRIIFDRFPKPGDEPFMLERAVDLTSQKANLKVIVENTIIEIYVNDQVALSARGYDAKGKSLGFFVSNGEVDFTNIKMATTG